MDSLLCESETLSRLSEANLRQAVSALRTWGCCPRCVLRFLGEKDPQVFRNSDEKDLQRWIEQWEESKEVPVSNGSDVSSSIPERNSSDLTDEPASTDSTNCCDEKMSVEQVSTSSSNVIPLSNTDEAVCIACLGILQKEFTTSSFIESIRAAVASLNFEFTSFLCSISVPVSMLLRDHSIYLAMKDVNPALYATKGANGEAGKPVYVATAKDVWKWVNGPILASKLNVNFDQNSLFEVILSFVHSDSGKECLFLNDIYPDIFRRRKHQQGGMYTRVNVAKAIEDMSAELFRSSYSCPPRPTKKRVVCEPVHCETKAMYIAGRYNKLSRALSQTPWLIEGQRKTESSIEELISLPINALVRASSTKFSASGREDVDVRMLGTGRPFVIEFVNPRRVTFTPADMIAIQTTINSSTSDVSVRDLQLVSKEETTVLKEGEEEKTKRYSALCWSKDPVTLDELNAKLTAVGELVVYQKTPLRVLHRRPLATRPRTVYAMSVQRAIDQHHFVLSLSTQAGTYIKEFVHGDFGRTSPNLGKVLGTDCDILELDVEAVELDWPKSLG